MNTKDRNQPSLESSLSAPAKVCGMYLDTGGDINLAKCIG